MTGQAVLAKYLRYHGLGIVLIMSTNGFDVMMVCHTDMMHVMWEYKFVFFYYDKYNVRELTTTTISQQILNVLLSPSYNVPTYMYLLYYFYYANPLCHFVIAT